MDSEENSFLEGAAAVFHEISLLEIRKSYRLLSERDPATIENFVQKYSDFAIFLLNILDHKRSTTLLGKLTDSALVYIVEEELRTLLIEEVGNIARVGGDFTGLTLFLELCDRPTDSAEIPPYVAEVLQLGGTWRARDARNHFAALDSVAAERREEVIHRIYERNLYVGVGLLIFASDQVLATGLDHLKDRAPALLALIPADWFGVRFRLGSYAPYTEQRVFAHLPESVQTGLQNLMRFLDTHQASMERLRELVRTEPDAVERRKQSLDLVYSLVQNASAEQIDLILRQFVQEGILSAPDRDLIRTVSGGAH